jgi:CHAD domain-containing protein
LKHVADAVRLARGAAQGQVAGKTAAAELRRLSRKLENAAKILATADTRPSTRGWQWALEARVARRASAVRTAIDAAGAVYLPERLHAVRIALKKLRYGVELWLEAGGSKETADLRRLKRSQELLGDLHDRHVLITHVRREQAALAPSEITPSDTKVWGELDALITSLENTCRALHARYVRDRAMLIALCDRLATRSDQGEAARRAG